MAKGTRYFTDDDAVGVTPSQLKRFGRARQIEYIKAWFDTYFEDPVHGAPWVDGEYMYPFGGPYEADDVIQDEFGKIVSYERMKEAIDDIVADGTTDWAPTSRHSSYIASYDPEADEADDVRPDADPGDLPAPTMASIVRMLLDGASVSLGSEEEKAERQALRDRVATLEEALARLRTAPPGPGHNGPPDDDGPEPKPTLAGAEADIATLKAEIERPAPDVLKVAQATSRLAAFGKWITDRAQKAVEKSFETAIVLGAGSVLKDAYEHGLPLVPPLIGQVEAAVIRWVEVAMRMF